MSNMMPAGVMCEHMRQNPSAKHSVDTCFNSCFWWIIIIVWSQKVHSKKCSHALCVSHSLCKFVLTAPQNWACWWLWVFLNPTAAGWGSTAECWQSYKTDPEFDECILSAWAHAKSSAYGSRTHPALDQDILSACISKFWWFKMMFTDVYIFFMFCSWTTAWCQGQH